MMIDDNKKSEKMNKGTQGIKSSLRNGAAKKLANSPTISPELKEQTKEELIHELQVHQIELEIQAEELRRSNIALEETRDRYLNLYDFAPLGYVTLNEKGLITEINLTAASLLNIVRSKLIKVKFGTFIAEKDSNQWHWYFQNVLGQKEKQSCDIALKRGDGSSFQARLESIRIANVYDGSQTIRMTISNITDVQKVENALRQANRKLTLLTSITRHDINNQVMALLGNLTLIEKEQMDQRSNELLLKVEAAAGRISSMIQFTKTYEDIGVNAPTWHDVRDLVKSSSKEVPLGAVKIINDIPAGTEVFADPLISKVFHNLIHNGILHGNGTTTIRFYLEESDGTRAIVCEDDGAGILVEKKDLLFTKCLGGSHGLGLFLSRDILDITGITIKEVGKEGHGAKFVLTMPMGGFRVIRCPNPEQP